MKKNMLRFLLFGVSSFFGFLLFSKLSIPVYPGGPFHGVSRDASGMVVNRVGPVADMVETIALVARSDVQRIEDGESAQLHAALRLDDGTITRLRTQEVEWTSESSSLSIADGLATAGDIRDRARVAVVANAGGYSATVYLRLLPGQAPEDAVQGLELPKPLADAIDLQLPGWKRSDWFGTFYSSGNNWILHSQHGWLYAAGGDAASAWL